MKKALHLSILSIILLTGCTEEIDKSLPKNKFQNFTAVFNEDGTKTFVDSDIKMHWNAEDCISIFSTTYNRKGIFQGTTGDKSGTFLDADNSFSAGEEVPTNYAVYPFDSNTSITSDGQIHLMLPETQVYAENSFGIGANTMVAATINHDSRDLMFNNLCGFLVLRLYGNGTVKKIIIEGNNQEKIAGASTVRPIYGEKPEVEMCKDATTTITLNCGAGVKLGTTPETATEFWFCIPPVLFSQGFTVTAINTNYWSMVKSFSSSKTVMRNVVNTMSTVEAVFDTRGVIEYSKEELESEMSKVYDDWKQLQEIFCFGVGLYYDLDMIGSDIERHPEAYADQPFRNIAAGLYENGNAISSYINKTQSISFCYEAIARVNNIINIMEASKEYEEYMEKANPTELSQLYGEAVSARATYYRELLKYYGDIPFSTTLDSASGISPRDFIYEHMIADLERVIPLMYRIGEVPGWGTAKNVFSRTYAEAMLGRLCLDAAGYQIRRANLGNDFYKNLKGEVVQFETIGKPNAKADNAFYGRRTDYKTFYEKAKKYYADIIANSGSAKLLTTDPRGEYDSNLKKYYGNPYQYFFQQNCDLVFADESIYEGDMIWNLETSERPYAFGRVSNGGSKNFFPCKSYGQCRINPAFYFGIFDPNDMRRDVACSVTGSNGSGSEILIPFIPNTKANGGGITCNKWDENRQAMPNLLVQRKSGIKSPYMRISEVYYGYAEACALTNEEAKALELLKTIRERSFPTGKANTDQFVKDCGGLFKAIIQDRGFEYAAEGDRRWTLIRTGLLPEKIKEIKELTADMIAGLETDGYYEFKNGNVISSNVWVKLVDGKALNGHRLTTQTPDGKENDPVLYPGWRGQNDDWTGTAYNLGISYNNIIKNLTSGSNTNLAIVGLFNHIESDSPEAKALEADGYEKKAYGSDLVKYKNEYLDNLFPNYDYESAPVYISAFSIADLEMFNISNGYGFPNSNN